MPAASTPRCLDELESIFRNESADSQALAGAIDDLAEHAWATVEAERVLALAMLVSIHPNVDALCRGKALTLGARAATARMRFKHALELLDKARRDFRSVRDQKGYADCDLIAGAVRTQTGKPTAALRSYRRAERTFRALGDARSAAACVYNRGLIHFQRTELQEALDCYLDAQRSFESLGLRLQAAICRMNVGNVHEFAGRYEDALQTFAAVRPEFEALGDSDRAARCRVSAGNAFAGSGRYAQAIGMFRAAGEVFHALGNERFEAGCLLNAAVAATELDRGEEATTDIRRALDCFCAVEDALGQGECYLLLSRIAGSRGDALKALEFFSRVGDKLQMADAHRALAKLDSEDSERHWSRALATISSALKGAGAAHLRYVAAEKAQEAGAALVTLALARGAPAEAGRIAERADCLTPRGTVSQAGLHIRFVSDRDRLHRLIRTDGDWSASSVDVSREELSQMCRELNEALSHPGSRTEDLRRRLCEILIDPRLGEALPISLAAGQPLDGLAFEALLDERGRCLIERNPVVHGRTIGSEHFRADECLAVTRSDFGGALFPLPGVDAEVEAIRRKAPGLTWLHQDRARVSEVVRQMARADLIHFATHAIDDSKNPLASGLVLEPDEDHPSGRLYARDIAKLKIRAKLVVLSACGTASGPQSLARAFLDAGAERVIAASWRAQDDAAQLWMSRFYGEMFEAGNCIGAHRAAARSMIQSDFRDPHFWALWRMMC